MECAPNCRLRNGRHGGSWRHVKEVMQAKGDRTVFMDGMSWRHIIETEIIYIWRTRGMHILPQIFLSREYILVQDEVIWWNGTRAK